MNTKFETVIVTGGSGINSCFARAGLLDEVVLNVEPIIVGRGIPVFKPRDFDLKQEFRNMVMVSGSILQ